MVFSSLLFLFFFLPAVLTLYFLGGRALWNPILLLASLFFYAWGETFYVLLMLFSIAANYVFGLLIERARTRPGLSARAILAAGIAVNLAPLCFFKYGNFLVDNINIVISALGFSAISLDRIHLPIGISFFTFQAISYIVDVYRAETTSQKNPIDLALYISLFPQLIAGPIVRYHDIAAQIGSRIIEFDDFYQGTKRFIIGLGKKVLVANVMGRLADAVFALPPERLSAQLAWLGIIAYTLQIYFDFSGYSDMAIGLGRMFGFRFRENFNYPYISRSIKEFWRRWHISLSTWFRDYLYIPLGGNKFGPARTYANLLTVFLLCGLWHGASWTFVIWGLYHGFFLVLERTRFGDWLDRTPGWLRHGYVLLCVMIGWVFFRSETLDYALRYLAAMFSPWRPPYIDVFVFSALNREFYLALIVGTVFSAPAVGYINRIVHGYFGSKGTAAAIPLFNATKSVFLIAVLVYSIASLTGGTHNPFLYFRF